MGGHGSVGELLKPGGPQELLAFHQPFAGVFDLVGREVRLRREHPHGEAITCDARMAEDALLGCAQQNELRLEHLLQGRRHRRRNGAQRPAQGPASTLLDDHVMIDHVPHDGRHEERIPARVAMDQAGETRREVGARELGEEIVRDIRVPQVFEGQLGAQTMDEEILLEHLQRVLRHHDVARTVRAEHHELRRSAPPGQRRDHVEGGEIDPVKVFEGEDERVGGGDRFQGFADLPHHPLPRRPDRLAVQRLSRLPLHQRRKLDEPGRCTSDQRRHRSIALGLAQQVTERFENRVVRLLAAEALDTLPARDAKARPLGGTTLKGLDERRLPYAGLARDEDDLSVTSPRLLETGLEQGPWSIAAHHGRGPRGQAGGRVAACLEHGRDELIAALGKGLDERRPVGSVAQGLPDF